MPLFTVFGLQLESDIDFPELPGPSREGSAARFRLGPVAAPPAHDRWVHEIRRDDGTPWLSTGPAADRVLLRFHDQADFLVAPGAVDVEARPVAGAAVAAVRWLFLDHVLPRALAGSGRLVFHASAVETPKGALVFLGESGSGKSTLAASFCASGARPLSDDGVLIESGCVIPSYPVHRLWASGVAALGGSPPAEPQKKHRMLPAAPWSIAPAPLQRIFLLAPHQPGRPWIEPVAGGEAILSLVKQAFRLDPTDRSLAAREFKVLGDLAASCFPIKLAHPRRAEDLAEVKIKISEFS